MNQLEALDYEVRSSWLAPLVSWGWAQALLGRYYARRVRRKWARYVVALDGARLVRGLR